MAVMNFRVRKIKAERTDKEAKNVNAVSNFTITSIKKESDKRIGDYLLVNFKFDVTYNPDFGSINLEGSIWYQDPKLEKMFTEKGGKIDLKSEAVQEVSTAILRDSLLEAVDISQKLRLPVPIQLPKVNVKDKDISFPMAAS